MVQVDVPVAFGVGSFFADAAYRQLQTRQPVHVYRTLALNNLYLIFFFSWIPVYFLLNYFGWETTHMWWHADSVTAYPFFVPIFMILFFLAANGGFLVGNWLVREGHVLANRLVYIATLVYSGIWIFTQTDSTFRLGTYAEWAAGMAPTIFEDGKFFATLVVSLLLWGVALAVFFIKLRKEGRQLAS